MLRPVSGWLLTRWRISVHQCSGLLYLWINLWIQDGEDINPILHRRDSGSRRLNGKWCETAMHHSFLHLDLKLKKSVSDTWLASRIPSTAAHRHQHTCRLSGIHLDWCGSGYRFVVACYRYDLSKTSWTVSDEEGVSILEEGNLETGCHIGFLLLYLLHPYLNLALD